jgi:hypothetical protein
VIDALRGILELRFGGHPEIAAAAVANKARRICDLVGLGPLDF